MRYALAALALAVSLVPTPAEAQADTATLNASLAGIARLSLSSGSLTFPDADPDTVPQITGVPAVIAITAKARASEGSAVTLTIQATDDLRSGVHTIPASSITWTATGAGFVDGTLSSVTPQPVASWIGSGIRPGTLTFRFQNLWSHPTGVYSVTIIFTLSAA